MAICHTAGPTNYISRAGVQRELGDLSTVSNFSIATFGLDSYGGSGRERMNFFAPKLCMGINMTVLTSLHINEPYSNMRLFAGIFCLNCIAEDLRMLHTSCFFLQYISEYIKNNLIN